MLQPSFLIGSGASSAAYFWDDVRQPCIIQTLYFEESRWARYYSLVMELGHNISDEKSIIHPKNVAFWKENGTPYFREILVGEMRLFA